MRGIVPRGIDGDRIGAGTTLAELEGEPHDPRRAPRGVPARRVAAAAEHGLARREPPPVDALLVLAARVTRAGCTAATAATRARASTASMRSSRTTSARRRIRPTSLRHCSRSTRACTRTAASSASPSCTGSRTRPTGATTTLEPGELILEVELPPVEASVYLKAMDRKRWALPAGRRRRGAHRRRDAHRARRRRADSMAPGRARGLDAATPFRGRRGRSTSPGRSSGARSHQLSLTCDKVRGPRCATRLLILLGVAAAACSVAVAAGARSDRERDVDRPASAGAPGDRTARLEPLPDPVAVPARVHERSERHRLPALDARRGGAGRVALRLRTRCRRRTRAGCSR